MSTFFLPDSQLLTLIRGISEVRKNRMNLICTYDHIFQLIVIMSCGIIFDTSPIGRF